MQDFEWWWVLAGVLGVVEVLTGTFYVLVLAIAAVGASILAKFGLGLHWQVLGAALVALLGWFWLRRRKGDGTGDLGGGTQDLDVGEWIEVDSWSDGLGSAQYRGAHWSVEPSFKNGAVDDGDKAHVLKPGKYRIQSLRGNRLIVEVLG